MLFYAFSRIYHNRKKGFWIATQIYFTCMAYMSTLGGGREIDTRYMWKMKCKKLIKSFNEESILCCEKLERNAFSCQAIFVVFPEVERLLLILLLDIFVTSNYIIFPSYNHPHTGRNAKPCGQMQTKRKVSPTVIVLHSLISFCGHEICPMLLLVYSLQKY